MSFEWFLIELVRQAPCVNPPIITATNHNDGKHIMRSIEIARGFRVVCSYARTHVKLAHFSSCLIPTLSTRLSTLPLDLPSLSLPMQLYHPDPHLSHTLVIDVHRSLFHLRTTMLGCTTHRRPPVARYRFLTPKSRCVQTEDIDEREPLVSRERPLTEARLAQSKLRTRYRSCSPRRIEGRSISCIQRRTVWSQFERIFEARAPWILSTAQKHC